jgi:hypothetical protein
MVPTTAAASVKASEEGKARKEAMNDFFPLKISDNVIFFLSCFYYLLSRCKSICTDYSVASEACLA